MIDIAELSRNFRWLELSRSGNKLVAIALLDHTTTRVVQAGIAAALAIEDETGQRLMGPLKLPRETVSPYTLEPLVHVNGITYREDVCPKHPGKRLVEPGVTAVHSNPEHAKWRNSNYCCLSCMRSANDYRIKRDFKDDPPRISLPEKPKKKPTRKEIRAKKNTEMAEK